MNKIHKFIRYFLLFLTIVSFFIQAVNIDIGFTLKPFHAMAVIDFLYLIFSRPKLKLAPTRIEKCFLLFFITILISIPFGIDPMASLKHTAGIVLLFISFYIFRLFFETFEKTKVLKIFESISFLYLIVTIGLYVAGLTALEFNFQRENIDILGVTIDRNLPRLISLSYNDPNMSAIYFAIPLAYFLSLKKWSFKKILGTLGFLTIIILTLSRGAFVALAVMFFVYLISLIHRKKKSASSVFSLTMIERFQSSLADSGSGRLYLWSWALEAFNTNPITGIGTGNISLYNKQHYWRLAPSHNSYLDILAEQGIIGAIFYVILLLVLIVKSWKLRRRTSFPILSLTFLLTSQLFLSLAISDMLFLNILIIELALFFVARDDTLKLTVGSFQKGAPKKKKEAPSSPKISFIVPVYNVENYIKKCLDSLLVQSEVDYEIILVDDGSTDKSTEICQEYASKYKTIHYFRTKNGGLSAARNYGLKKATGEYVWFVDSDDFIYSDALKILKNSLKHDIITIGYYNYYNDYTISDGNNTNTKDAVSNFYLNPAMAQLKITKREIFTKNKLSFTDRRNYEDVGLMYSLPKYTKDIYCLNEKLYFYRRRSGSIATTFSEKNFKDHIWAISELAKNLDDGRNAEVTYQIILQTLFTAFDINKKTCPKYKKYFDELRSATLTYLKNYDYSKNKYLTHRSKKNLAYKIYLSKLMNKKYHSCLFLNKLRKRLIKVD